MSRELGWDVTSSFSPVKSTGHVHRCEAIRARQGVGGHVRRWHLGFRQPRVQVLRLTHPRGDCAKTIFLFCSVSSLKSTSNDLIRLLRAFNVIMRAKCFPGGSTDKESACNAGDLGWEKPLEKGIATHSSILAWRIPWTEEPGGLQLMGSQRVGHD